VDNARSNKVSLLSNEIFGNTRQQITVSGSALPGTITDWQTGQTYASDGAYMTIKGNKVKGNPVDGTQLNECWPGPCGWVLWVSGADQFDYFNRTVTADFNQWFHTSTTKSFRVPDTYGRAVDFPTFGHLMSTVKQNEGSSTWADPGSLSCTPPIP
jgi:hypothetical protein